MAQGIRLVQDDSDWSGESLNFLVNLAADLKSKADVAAAKYEEVRAQIQGKLVEQRFKAFDADQLGHPGKVVRAVYSSNTRTKVDEEGLKKALKAVQWRHITKQKVDMDLLNTAVLEKTIDPEVVQKFLVRTEHPNVRFYVGLDKKEEIEDGGPQEDH